MDNMQEQMGAILNNPEMMQKIMAMAQTLNTTPPDSSAPMEAENTGLKIPDIDPSMLQKLSGLAGQTTIDQNQRTLLKALKPYLSRQRITKLEKAMRAAKMAGMASVFLNQSGFSFHPGR